MKLFKHPIFFLNEETKKKEKSDAKIQPIILFLVSLDDDGRAFDAINFFEANPVRKSMRDRFQ